MRGLRSIRVICGLFVAAVAVGYGVAVWSGHSVSAALYANADVVEMTSPRGNMDGTWLDADFHRDALEPTPDTAIQKTLALIYPGSIAYESEDHAWAWDNRRITGRVHDVPANTDVRWKVVVNVRHEHYASAEGWDPEGGWYEGLAGGTSTVEFKILTSASQDLNPPREEGGDMPLYCQVDNTQSQAPVDEEHHVATANGQGQYNVPKVLQLSSYTDIARLDVQFNPVEVSLRDHMPGVVLAGAAKLTVNAGGYISAWNFTTNEVIKQLDGQTDATWPVE